MLQLSPNAEQLLVMMVGYYINGITFIDKNDISCSDQAIYEVVKKSCVQFNGEALTLTANYITNLY
jgi:hypothetical protein